MKYIIITGGGMINKGAQAMTMIAVDQLSRRFPEHHILLYDQENQREGNYKFGYLSWYPIKFARAQKNPLLRVLCLLRSKKELLECERIYKNTDLLVDISGYALGSNWSEKICNNYLDPIEFAHAFGIPVYLMPQSFGPFDFENPELVRRCRELLPTVKVICAREQEGYDALVSTYNLTNVIRTTDLVLNNRGMNLTSVYQQVPELHLPKLAEKSVGIIPNYKNSTVSNHDAIAVFYHDAIARLLSYGNTVYILSHSELDKELCRELKQSFVDESSVVLLDQELSCVEFDALVKGFRYLLASRFHSIVHAYKNGVPCIALGWAVKYHDLLEQFGQSEYCFDSRQTDASSRILCAVDQMEHRCVEESCLILNSLQPLQENNVFDIIH